MPFVRHGTLTANTVATVTVTGNPSAVVIINRNALADIYVSYDGTAAPANPTVGGNDFDVVPSAVGAGIVIADIDRRTDTNVVKLISSSATSYTIRGVQ